MNRTFASLANPNYRFWFAGALISNAGTWMGRVAQDWLVLVELTDHSASALGFVTGLQFLPFLLLAPWTGVVADRFPKRRIMYVTQSAQLLNSALVFILVATGTAQLWMIFGLAAMQGVAAAFDAPTRQAFAAEVVDPTLLANAVSLNSASFNAARMIGPGLAGLIIAGFGTAPVFALNALSYAALIIFLRVLDPSRMHPAPPRRGRGAIREGFGYVRRRPDILIVLFMVFMLGTFGLNFQITTALMATQVFHVGAGGYGILGSIMAIGSLAGALLSARRGRPSMRVLVGALGGFSAASLLAGLAPNYWLFAVLLIPTGLFALTVMTTANSTVQLAVDPAMRGRVMALYVAIFFGGTPVGAPIIGWIGDAWGARWTILVGSIATAVTVLVVLAWQWRRSRQDRPASPLDEASGEAG